MAIWVGLFVNNLDRSLVREIEVKASSEVEALVMLDLYDYDETWQNYSFFSIYKKQGDIKTMLVCLKQYWAQIITTIQDSPSKPNVKNPGNYAYLVRHRESLD
jgi:hypothetical protein